MQVLAVCSIAAAFATLCAVIYLIGWTLRRRGHDLSFVDPRYPESMQAVGAVDLTAPGRPALHDDISLVNDDDDDSQPA